MADESDVEATLITIAASIVYPDGTGAPSSLLNMAPCRLFRGWPVEQNLKTDLGSGICNISVYSRNGVDINVTRYPREPIDLSRTPHTITLAVIDNSITIGGTVATPQTLHVKAGGGVSVVYAVQSGDTLTTIATGLATLLASPFPGTTSNGPVITIPASVHAGLLTARVATQGVVAREVKRQDKSFQISLWAATPELRDSMASVVDPVLGDLRTISLPDGSKGWIRSELTMVYDTAEEEGLYRRDLFYKVEYPTIRTEVATEIGIIPIGLTGGQSDPDHTSNPQAPAIPVSI